MSRPYHTLAQPSEFCFEEKRSRFVAYLYPISNKEQGFKLLNEIKTKHPDARHHCWAYVIGNPEQALAAGFNDDGEPGGTAGKPMLNVLSQRKVGDVFAVVARYFGGIKLGAGGLTRAYGQAVSGALDLAQLRQIVPQTPIDISIDFAQEQRVRNLLTQYAVEILTAHYTQQVNLHCLCSTDQLTQFSRDIRNLTAGQVIVRY